MEAANKLRLDYDLHDRRSTWLTGLKRMFEPGGVGLVLLAFFLAVASAVPINMVTGSEVPPEVSRLSGIPGMLWLRIIRAVVLPLIMASMVLSMYRLRKIEGAGRKIVVYIVGYYITTTVLSVGYGLVVGVGVIMHVVEPIPEDQLRKLAEATSDTTRSMQEDIGGITVADQIVNIFESLIPANVIASMANDELLSVIACGMAIGLLVSTNHRSPIIEFMEEIESIVGKIIRFVILLAPLAVFFLLFASLVILDMQMVMQLLSVNIGVQFAATFLFWLTAYPGLYFIVTRENPFRLFPKIMPVTITGLGTGSSAATLPVTLRYAAELGVPKQVADFALPLGMTVCRALVPHHAVILWN